AVPTQLLVDGGQVVLTVDDVDVGQQAATLAYQVQAAPQQVARLTHPFGVSVGKRETAAAQQARDLVGVDAVVLAFAAVNQFHVARVPEDQRHLLFLARVVKQVHRK